MFLNPNLLFVVRMPGSRLPSLNRAIEGKPWPFTWVDVGGAGEGREIEENPESEFPKL